MGQKAPQSPPKHPPFQISISRFHSGPLFFPITMFIAWGKGGKGGGKGGKGGWGAVDTSFPAPRLQANVRSNCLSNLELFQTVGELILSNRPTRQPCSGHILDAAREFCCIPQRQI
eukprot:1161325-Pelagomonas_calceolata.AAC.23